MLYRFLFRIFSPQLRYHYSPKIRKNPLDSTKDVTEFPTSSSDSDVSSDESFSDIDKNDLLSDSSDDEIIVVDIDKNNK